MKKRRLSYERKKGLMGLVFVSPWILGVSCFFLYPLISAMAYVFNEVSITPNGQVFEFVGFENIRFVFFEDPDNFRTVVTSFMGTLGEVILIIAFSIFLAIILCQNFKGKTFSRAVFALPIIVSSGVLLSVFKNDLFSNSVQSGSDVNIFQSAALEGTMINLGLDPSIVSEISQMVSDILDLLWKSGVQILLFIAGIQSIPPHLYEVGEVEGATAWLRFWKITFPLLSPFILLNTVYTIIDAFTYYSNPVMMKVTEYFEKTSYSSSTTLAICYSLYVLAITAIVVGLISRKITYVEK